MTIELTAYEYQSAEGWTLEPAETTRPWMHETIGKAALRCLPLAIANQAGWIIRSPCAFKARWVARKPEPSSLVISFPDKKDEARYAGRIITNFGSGIITFALPWLFRTSEGIGIWVHGPGNDVRGDVVPLEGLVETDWSPSPFTMNWKITKPKVDVWFREGEPICRITPFPMGLLDECEPKLRLISRNRDLNEAFLRVAKRRNEARAAGDPAKGKFELGYIRATEQGDVEVAAHRTNLKLQPFADEREG